MLLLRFSTAKLNPVIIIPVAKENEIILPR